MINNNHWAFFLSNKADKQLLIEQLTGKNRPDLFEAFSELKPAVFSAMAIKKLIEEEELHGYIEVATTVNRHLRFLSGGEQKKALLTYLLSKEPGCIIVDNPMDNLDAASQKSLLQLLVEVAVTLPIIQLVNRTKDCLPFIKNAVSIDDGNAWSYHDSIEAYIKKHPINHSPSFTGSIPPSDHHYGLINDPLVEFKNVTVKYEERPIVNNICWQINKGEFWHLIGPNGSGKTTLLSLITGDNPKGYGQDLILFGKRKGTGETVWSIKEKVGYFTASMTDLFNRYHSVEQMVVSGFYDSIGLYTKPSDRQLKLAHQWLSLIGFLQLKQTAFYKLSLGQQRLIMVVRAMVKHPPLLILDEPTVGLDDDNVAILVMLINKMAAESNTAILYVSHRAEDGLTPTFIFELTPMENGSRGIVL
jgi:molybdate transport system ATP-binding protein